MQVRNIQSASTVMNQLVSRLAYLKVGADLRRWKPGLAAEVLRWFRGVKTSDLAFRVSAHRARIGVFFFGDPFNESVNSFYNWSFGKIECSGGSDILISGLFP